MSRNLNQGKLWHGGDYNPEQWPRETWDADARLMDAAHWNTATIGVFSWVSLEPEEGRYTFDWLDEAFERLYVGGRDVILATPSAAQPAWMSRAYPEILRTGADGVRNRHGNRVNYCLTSPIYREKVRNMAAILADRYGDHPALALWHVSNEYGGACHCDLCQGAFRSWLRRKFDGDLEALNHAYWTAFWSHTYTEWEQVEIPGGPYGERAVHGLTLDWQRFVSDQTIDFYLNESAPLRERTPNIPLTTNFMGFFQGLDYAKFGKHVDVVSWDSYPRFMGPLTDANTWITAAMTHDLMRSVGGGKPYLLMECTPSASNWYSAMELKSPGMHVLEGLQAIAHGSDSVQYFQWRQSRGSQEKFHGAVVQHDGTERTRVFQEVAQLGRVLEDLSHLAGVTIEAEVALLYDWENSWAIDAACGLTVGDRGYLTTLREHYAPFWQLGIPVDLVSSTALLDGYKLVIAPMMYMIQPRVAEELERFVVAGGVLVGTYWSGIADENDLCFLGGFPGGSESPLRRLFGIWNEDTDALDPEVVRRLAPTYLNTFDLPEEFTAKGLCAMIHPETAEVEAHYMDGFYAGQPAVTRNSVGEGEAIYLASRNDENFQRVFAKALADRLGLKRAVDVSLPLGVTAQRRGDTVFLLNCTPKEQMVGEDVLRPFEAKIVAAGVPTGASG